MDEYYAVTVTAPSNGIFSLPKLVVDLCMKATKIAAGEDATVTRALVLKYSRLEDAEDAFNKIRERAQCIGQGGYAPEIGRVAVTLFPPCTVLSKAWSMPSSLPGGMAWNDGYAFEESEVVMLHSFMAEEEDAAAARKSIAPISMSNFLPENIINLSTYSPHCIIRREKVPVKLTMSTSVHVLNSDRSIPGIMVIPGNQNKSFMMAARCIVTDTFAEGLPLQTGLLQAWDAKKLGIKWSSQYVVLFCTSGKKIKLVGRVKPGIACTMPDVNLKLEAVRRMKIQYARVCRVLRLFMLSRPDLKHMVNYTGDEDTREYDALGVDEEESDTDEGSGIRTFRNSGKGFKYKSSVNTLTKNIMDYLDGSTPVVKLTGAACVSARKAATAAVYEDSAMRPLKRARVSSSTVSPEARAFDTFWAAFEMTSSGVLRLGTRNPDALGAALSAVNHVGEFLSTCIKTPEELECSQLAKALILLQKTASIPDSLRRAAFEFIEPID